ncbi:6-hydroxymethylpterin diphosphokinase MptE-like protein [Treponema sp.]|uniref:6-hydroxymethylpterin diphosphokinase MptE-like protein n=1 Tax=Treponema sp. TaxID=166 RepID=UPI00388ED337
MKKESLLSSASKIVFEKSRNGELTCSFDGIYLHSKYSPLTEGERFARNLQADFSPFCIFIIEPALSYCASFLKKRFPDALICAVRLCSSFTEYDSQWDKVFYFDNSSDSVSFSEVLFNFLGEEKLISSLTFDWTPSKQIFQEHNSQVWQEIKKAILKARDVIGTRAYFSKRWLKNSITFASYIKNTVVLSKTNQPVVITASGPSLKSSIPFLKKYRNSFFLIAVSSSFMPLLENEIIPDFVMSSDGGFWAKKHLNFPSQSDCDTIFALEAESAVPKNILETKKILPLIYEDGLEKDFLEAIECPYLISKRNGTVSGTALEFALSFTDKNVFLCGFDQEPASGFQHTQPNALETDNEKNDFRLKPKETRITCSRFNSEKSLEIYRSWFISNSQFFEKRVFRLSDNYKYSYQLGKITEINWDKFIELSKGNDSETTSLKEKQIDFSKEKRQKIIKEKLKNLSKTKKFIDEVFPMESILIKRELSESKKAQMCSELEKKIQNLIESI